MLLYNPPAEPAKSFFAPPPTSSGSKSRVSSHSGVNAETVEKFNRLLKLFPDRSTELSDLWNKVGAAAQASAIPSTGVRPLMTIATKDGGGIPLYSLGAVGPSSAKKLSWTTCADGSLRPHPVPGHQPFDSEGNPWPLETATGRWVAPVDPSNPDPADVDDVIFVDPWGQMVSSDTRVVSVPTERLHGLKYGSLIVPKDQPFHPNGLTYALQVTDSDLGFADWIPRPDYPEEKPMAHNSTPSTVGYTTDGKKLIDWDSVRKPVGWTPSEVVFTVDQEICTDEPTTSIETFSKPAPEPIPHSAPGHHRTVHFASSNDSTGHSHACEPAPSTATTAKSNVKQSKRNKKSTIASTSASRPAFSQVNPQASQPSVAKKGQTELTLDDLTYIINAARGSKQSTCNFSQASRPMDSYRSAFSAVA